jgi:hypothetical protein
VQIENLGDACAAANCSPLTYHIHFWQNLGANTPRPAGNAANLQTPCERLVTISDLKTEERKQKLSRYRKKKIKRNFGRKIKVLVLCHCFPSA